MVAPTYSREPGPTALSSSPRRIRAVPPSTRPPTATIGHCQIRQGTTTAASMISRPTPDAGIQHYLTGIVEITRQDNPVPAMLGRVWAAGGAFDWGQIWGEARRNRLENLEELVSAARGFDPVQ